MISKLLHSEKRNIYLFYILSAIMSFWFIESNWIYFWTRYMTYGQLGWVDALGFGFAVILEIPSGAVADLLGKRKTILIGMVAGVIGISLVTFSDSLSGILIGWLITQVTFAFYSGAGEALAYDTLVDLKQESAYDRVITKSSEISKYAAAITMFAGGFLYDIYFRLPHILWAIGFGFGVIFSWLLVEPKIDTEKFNIKIYINQLIVGFKELFQTGLRRYIGFFFGLVGVYFIYDWGLIKPAIATSFGFFEKEQAIILPLMMLLGAAVVKGIPYFRTKISDIAGLSFLSVIMSVGFLSAAFFTNYLGIFSIIFIVIAGSLATPWISIIINKKIESRYRATTLSTVALMTKLPYVLIAATAGMMIEDGRLPIFNTAVGVAVLIAAALSLILIKLKPPHNSITIG